MRSTKYVRQSLAASREITPRDMRSAEATILSFPFSVRTEDAGNAPKLEVRFRVLPVSKSWVDGRGPSPIVASCAAPVRSSTSSAADVPELTSRLFPCWILSRTSRRFSILSFHLNSSHQKGLSTVERMAYEASSSSSICKLLFTVHESPRVLHRVHGAPVVLMSHLTLILELVQMVLRRR
jgi:hypothetical protein